MPNERELVTHMLRNHTRRTRHTIGLFTTFFMLVGVLVTVAETPASATAPGANGKIAYQRDGAIWTMNADGSPQTKLTSPTSLNSHREPAWSPDGTKIAYFFHSGSSTDIAVINADGTGTVNLTNTPGFDEFEPTWSPDGTRIAYSRSNTIWTMGADGSQQAALTSPAALEYHREPAWSPDGTKIAYRYHLSGSPTDIAPVLSPLIAQWCGTRCGDGECDRIARIYGLRYRMCGNPRRTCRCEHQIGAVGSALAIGGICPDIIIRSYG